MLRRLIRPHVPSGIAARRLPVMLRVAVALGAACTATGVLTSTAVAVVISHGNNGRSAINALTNAANAITSTISRTIITHGSTQIAVLAMLLFGGAALHYFALALTIGICFGIYSSVLVMAPLVRWLGVKREDLVKPVRAKRDEAVV